MQCHLNLQKAFKQFSIQLNFFAAPTVAESSDESDNETSWKQSSNSEIIGSEAGVGVQVSASYIPVPGGPFSALVPTMWPQDILALIQQVCFQGDHSYFHTSWKSCVNLYDIEYAC